MLRAHSFVYYNLWKWQRRQKIAPRHGHMCGNRT